MPQHIYTMNGLSKLVPPNKYILKDIYLSFFPGAKIGVLGLNGAGKSTLLRIMAGVDTEYQGEARVQPGVKIGYLSQEPALDVELDVRGNVEKAVAPIKELLQRFDDISAKFAEPMDDGVMNALLEEQGNLQDAIDAVDGWGLERRLAIAADALRLPAWDANVTHLSGGEKRRVALCQLLMSSPDMLLLDEPTNHLDAESVAWLEKYLQNFPGTIVAVTHDRYFLDNVAGWILELDRGQGIPYEGNYSAWLEQKEQRLAQESKQQDNLKRAINAELEWVRSNPKGRQAKNKARLARFSELNSREFQQRNETMELYIPPGPRLGDKVIVCDKVNKGYDGRTLLESLSCEIPPGAIVGIIGANGAGKSTLFRMLTEQEIPDAGTIEKGETVQLAYVDQSRDALSAEKTVWQEISDGQDIITIGHYTVPSRAYVGRFNFKGPDQQKLIGNLSGGERNRVHLAKLLRSGGNVLLLDEPTNDLDVETLRALEQALLNFPGCVLVVSHDRWFLDRIATHILAYEEAGKTELFLGNYSEYEAFRLKTLGESAVQPRHYKAIQ